MPVVALWRHRVAEHRRLLAALSVSALLHISLLLAELPWDTETLLPAAELSVRRFVKRLPRSQRPLSRRQIARVVQRPLSRPPGIRAVPEVAVARVPLAHARQQLRGTPIPPVTASLPALSPPTLVDLLPDVRVGPTFRPGAVHGQRVGSQGMSLALDLLDPEALDTGRRRAVVVVDPGDRRRVRGFLHLSSIYSEALERSEADAGHAARRHQTYFEGRGIPSRAQEESRVLQSLADALSERSGVKAGIRDGLSLSDPRTMEAPFMLLTVNAPFEVSDAETAALGRYLISGGFLYAEVVSEPRARNYDGSDLNAPSSMADPALRALIREALDGVGRLEGRDWDFVQLEPEHPLYHCFYDFDSLPPGYWLPRESEADDLVPSYLEGIQLGGRLVGVYSLRDYADAWVTAEDVLESDQPMPIIAPLIREGAVRLGVNILVFALTREGSLAQKLVAE